ncbi:hypothetical protein BGZ63DRAFT_352376 [Mariannaea sp. PMI_226]|nr:hypothetical protein BGZ63DRAFT_352376 [Mariannaea sp. PMI_226]
MASFNPSYAPLVPSLLNPSKRRSEACGAARVVRRRKNRPGRSHTLTQRFLRIKAAEAWREHVLSSQLIHYESMNMRPIVHKTRCCSTPLPRLDQLGLRFSFVGCSGSGRDAVLSRLPELPRWTTPRVVLAVGLVGVIPALGVRNLLQSVEPL